jgi:RING finger protein 113A
LALSERLSVCECEKFDDGDASPSRYQLPPALFSLALSQERAWLANFELRRRHPMASKGKNFRKKARDDSDDEGGGATRPGPPPAKRPALVNSFGAVTKQADAVRAEAAVAELHSFASTRSAKAHDYGGGAFATTEVDTAIDRDAQAIFEKKVAMQQEAVVGFESGKPREYKGMAGYSNFIPKDALEAKSQAKMSGTMGPLRAPTNIRGICRVDYQPDTCKDYTQTGFCSFGDSCKFLHDRSERKASYLIDKEWDAEQKRKRQALERKLRGGGDDDDADAEDTAEGAADATGKTGLRREELPFACHICRQKFTKPVVTQCGHYFCEGCAVRRYAANPNCAVCAKPTLGIFNVARKLLAREATPDVPEDVDAGGFGAWSDARAADAAPGTGRLGDAESGSGSADNNESGNAAGAMSRSDDAVAAPAP